MQKKKKILRKVDEEASSQKISVYDIDNIARRTFKARSANALYVTYYQLISLLLPPSW